MRLSPHGTRRLACLTLVLLVNACLPAGRRQDPRTLTDAEYLRSRELMVPVHGVSPRQLRDTYSARRSGGRTHNALDIMARKGTRVLSADDGVVLRVVPVEARAWLTGHVAPRLAVALDLADDPDPRSQETARAALARK